MMACKKRFFPYYNYCTTLFLWLFCISLSVALTNLIDNWLMVSISIAISFAFSILNKTVQITETPFEGRAVDRPISSIVRGIEIDLLQIIEVEEIPEALPPVKTICGVVYSN